jgi:lipopolysaccharide transport system permease protein
LNFALILTFTRQDLIDRYSSSLLGGVWTLINPLVQILIYTLIFSKIMGARLSDLGVEFTEYGYSIYLVPAVLAWSAFGNTLTRVTTIFQDKAGLIGKVSLSLRALPLYILLSETIVFLISMSLFAIFLLLIGYPITWMWLLLIPVYLVQQLLAYGLGFGAAVLGVFVRDVVELVRITVQIWFWLTPIVYVLDILPQETQELLSWNPMTHFVTAFREVILYARAPDLEAMSQLLALGLAVLALALYGFKRLEKDMRDFI